MQVLIGWIILIFGGLLYVAQIISSINFELAQKIGIQESPDHADSLVQTSERYIAYWDLVTLGWFPIAGLLMIINHQYWPAVALVAAGIYFDTSGREAVKIISFRKEGLKLGTQRQQKYFFASYFFMAGLASIVFIFAFTNMVLP